MSHQPLLRGINDHHPPQPIGLFRWLMVSLMGLAGVLVIWTRTAQSVAIIPWKQECNWSEAQKQMQLSAFFYGYVGSMWMGPVLCTRLGGHKAFGAVTFFAVISQALGPLAECDPYAAGAVRVLVGAFEGPFYPCAAYLIGRWFTESEYSRAQLVMTIGATCGSLVGFPLSSIMCTKMGWHWAYYLPALTGPAWLLLWAVVASSTPAENRCIGRAEQRYLATAVRASGSGDMGADRIRVKPVALMCNGPVLAVTLCNFASAWAAYTLMTELPTYLEDQGFDLKQAGLWSDVPIMGPILIGVPIAWMTDTLIKQRCASTIAIRKGVNAFALGGQMGSLLAISFLPTVVTHLTHSGSGSVSEDSHFYSTDGSASTHHPMARQMSPAVVRISVVLLGIAVGCGSCLSSAAIANVFDIAPSTAGHVTSFYNCLSNVAGIIVPPVTGLIQHHFGCGNSVAWELLVPCKTYKVEIGGRGCGGLRRSSVEWHSSRGSSLEPAK
jgi:ACS family sodium-dependent inorganic phosphate cotransporter-like MFS transporter 5